MRTLKLAVRFEGEQVRFDENSVVHCDIELDKQTSWMEICHKQIAI